ncbi:MAG: alpha/beta hydrolase [Caulobacterales bacterium]|nr:alpha/beta hydrolase [Caulobacterales bacterium]
MKVGNFAAAVVASALAASCASMGDRDKERVDGRPTKYVSNGDGAPTVVFEADIGEEFDAWKPIFREVSEHSRAFAYTRPRYDRGNPLHDAGGARTGESVARHLRQTLQEAGVEPPYVLVGHAVGGLYALTFAKMHPGEVAGVVLVDGRPAAFTESCERLQLDSCRLEEDHAFFATAETDVELRGLAATEHGSPDPADLGRTPVTLIVATKAERGVSHARQAHWTSEQRRFYDQLLDGRYVEAVGSSHRIHHQDPYLVIREIRAMVDKARAVEYVAGR